jgi:branched-chain amino acid transport system ATP-binding protein
MSVVRLDRIAAGYASARVLFDLSLHVGAGEVVSLMGRNGMGKSTTLRAIMGLVTVTGGTIALFDRDITNRPSHVIARAGVGYVPEGREIFPTLSVRENLLAVAANPRGLAIPWDVDRTVDLFPRLGERLGQMAGTLSGGEQQMLAIGRALMTNPLILLLDEATEGLAPLVREEIWAALNDNLKAAGQAILIVDQHPKSMMKLADRHYILENGHVIWEGSSPDLAADEDLLHRYLGV